MLARISALRSKARRSQGLCGSQSNPISKLQLQWKTMSQKLRWTAMEEDTWPHPLAFTCAYAHSRTPRHTHIWKNMKSTKQVETKEKRKVQRQGRKRGGNHQSIFLPCSSEEDESYTHMCMHNHTCLLQFPRYGVKAIFPYKRSQEFRPQRAVCSLSPCQFFWYASLIIWGMLNLTSQLLPPENRLHAFQLAHWCCWR